MVQRNDVQNVRKVIDGFCVRGACPTRGLGENGELASVGRHMPLVVCEVEVEEGTELDGVALAGLERKVDGRGVVVLDRAAVGKQAESKEGRVGRIHDGLGEEEEGGDGARFITCIERESKV